MLVMENIRAFANAALPWVAMGLLAAILAARNAPRKNKGKSRWGLRQRGNVPGKEKTAHRRNIRECRYL